MHLHSEDQKNSRKLIADIMAAKINDEKITKRMVPDFALGCRRMTPGSGYLESLTKHNVQVVHESVVRLTKNGVVDGSGVEHEVDVVVRSQGCYLRTNRV
jgi:cation diffusion facilitator CzcD-associated flavoprotein CzcO